MARKESRNYIAPTIDTLSGYHRGDFESLKFYNSDRIVNLDSNYKVSSDNTRSTLTITKVGAPVKAFGIEWETCSPISGARTSDGQYISSTVLVNILKLAMSKADFPDDFWKIESDCTVSAECITQTFSKAWLRNNYKSFKALYEIAESLQFTTNDERCGMHVNIDLSNFGKDSAEQEKNVRKLGYLINKHYNFFKVALYRQGTTHWCPRMNYTVDYWKNTSLGGFPIGHDSCCINMGHIREGRVEIRLVGGQKNYACFRNTMEVVFHIIDAVKKLSWNDLDDLTKVFNKCNYHVADRIKSYCLRQGVISQADADAIVANSTDERFL